MGQGSGHINVGHGLRLKTIKSQCLNHFVCLSLKHINREWFITPEGEIKREQKFGGIISNYYREAA